MRCLMRSISIDQAKFGGDYTPREPQAEASRDDC